jgi:ubiquinone/menaquinone biosynthesis C-methylase UbiE
MASSHYVIRGGLEGRERLRVLARVMRPSTLAFFDRAGIRAGASCLDAGCGGGDVALDLARLVGPTGRVLGIDLDAQKIEAARAEAAANGCSNIEFRVAGIGSEQLEELFDVAYCRFVLTHLAAPQEALSAMWRALRPGGILLVADIDFAGHFWYPECPAQSGYVQLYTEAVRRRGGDACIGPRLPSLFAETGFEGVQVNVVQPAGLEGEVKLIAPITMENIADAVLAEGLASSEEIQRVISDLYDFAHAKGTLVGLPRIFEVSGRRPNG